MNYTQLLAKTFEKSEHLYWLNSDESKTYCYNMVEALSENGKNEIVIQRSIMPSKVVHSIGITFGIDEGYTKTDWETYDTDEQLDEALAYLVNTFGNLTPRI